MKRGLSVLGLGAIVIACSGRPAAVPSTDKTVTLLFFGDAHVDLETHPELFWTEDGTTEVAQAGGYTRMATAAKAIKKETGGRAVLVDGGDTF